MMADTSDKPAYRVLARKYRPSDFSTLIGQEPMVRTLTNAFSSGRIAQAWMLTGVRGVGKTTTARILARALNYQTDTINQPQVDLTVPGIHCEAIMQGRHVDIVEMDAASHTGIDDIKQIIDGVRYAPVSARYKVYIIDEIHMLSDKAFNALLKTLEEPPPHAKFIFATTEIRKVPVTVLSRCQRFDLRRIEPDAMVRHLQSIVGQEGVHADDAALALIARAGEGSVRDSLSMLDQAIAHAAGPVTEDAVRAMLGLADRAAIVDLFEHLMAGHVAEALAGLRAQYDVGADPVVVLNDLASFTHLVSRLHYVPDLADRDVSLSPDERERGADFAKRLPVTVLARTWQMLLKGLAEVEAAPRPIAAAEMVLIRIGHAATLPTLDEALKKLDDAPSHGAASTQRAPGSAMPQGPAAVRSVSSGGGAVAAGAVAPDRMSQPEPEGQAVTASARPVANLRLVVNQPDVELKADPSVQTEVTIASMEDLADLAAQNRDPGMRAQIRQSLRPVSFEAGRIVVGLAAGADRTLPGALMAKLREWTGRSWEISVSEREGGLTLDEEDRRQRQDMLDDAGRDPAVAQLLELFPGAKVVDVRFAQDALADEPMPLDTGEMDTDMPLDAAGDD